MGFKEKAELLIQGVSSSDVSGRLFCFTPWARRALNNVEGKYAENTGLAGRGLVLLVGGCTDG
jgi:hypothetical protein